jgi:hypothetical protein
MTAFAGVRYLGLDEQFNLLAIDADDGFGAIAVATENQLVGLQAGGACEHCCGAWTFGALVKAGVYGNFSESDILIAEQNIPAVALGARFNQDSDDLSFVGEALLGANYCLGAGFSLRAGYQLTWLHGVALAPEQLAGNAVPFVPLGVDTDGEALYHGAYLGLGWTR